MGRIAIVQGDITQQNVDVIVNAANKRLAGGGGVDGAIHRAAGPSVMEECRRIGGCPAGGAVITSGGNLPAKNIIHTVGPVWGGGARGEARCLENAYRNSFALAKKHGLRSIAFPSISTGVYGYPVAQAAEIALGVGHEFLDDFDEIRYVTFSAGDYEVYRRTVDRLNH